MTRLDKSLRLNRVLISTLLLSHLKTNLLLSQSILFISFSHFIVNYSRVDGEKGKDLRQRNSNNGSSAASINNNNIEGGNSISSTNLNCVQCNKVLPKPESSGILSTNHPVQCSICSLRVCKGCAVWNQAKNTLTCGHCHPPT